MRILASFWRRFVVILLSTSLLMIGGQPIAVAQAPLAGAVSSQFYLLPANQTPWETRPNYVLPGQPVKMWGTGTREVCPMTPVASELWVEIWGVGSYIEYHMPVRSDGTWGPLILNTDPNAQVGWAQVTVQCLQNGQHAKWIGDQPFDYVSESTEVAVEDPYMWGVAEFESTQRCAPGAFVDLRIFGGATDGSYGDPFATLSDAQFMTDSNGFWAYSELIRPDKYVVGETYYMQGTCIVDWDNYDWDNYNEDDQNRFYDNPVAFTIKGDYVALGDSYSSGEGSFNYNVTNGISACHGSTDGYPYYVADHKGLGFPKFAACSGAVTHDILYAGDVAAQLDAVTSGVKVVTLTIGGNDMGFAEAMEMCLRRFNSGGWGCKNDPYLPNALNDRRAALAGSGTANTNDGVPIHSILSVLQAIHQKAPSAKIYIAGYPELFGDSLQYYEADNAAPGGGKCTQVPTSSISYSDAQWLNQQAQQLNAVIQQATVTAGLLAIDTEYVPVTRFDTHGQCDSGTAWIHPVMLTSTAIPASESLHPTVTGMQQGYGEAFLTAMN